MHALAGNATWSAAQRSCHCGEGRLMLVLFHCCGLRPVLSARAKSQISGSDESINVLLELKMGAALRK